MNPSVPAPPETFNFARHLLEANAKRPDKVAFIDDAGALTYGALDERARRLAGALKDAGVKREERVMLLMHDSADWPVAFLGALLAGVVPVAVNTLLTADDYAYMLEHCRAQAVLVSGAVKPALKAALTKSDHEVHKVVVSRPTQPLEFGEAEFEAFLGNNAPLARPARTHADDPAFWLYSSGSTGRPKGTVHSHANPYWTAELYGKAILGLNEDDVCFSAAKLFFAYGLGNALAFPLTVRNDSLSTQCGLTPACRRRDRHVVNQPRLAESGGGEGTRRSGDPIDGGQAFGVDHGDIVDRAEAGRKQRRSGLHLRRPAVGAGRHGLRERDETAMHRRRCGAFGGVEIAVAGGHGETVALAHRRTADDFDRQVEVARQSSDDLQLLVVLFAEIGAIGQAGEEELGDHRRHAVEMAGAERAAKPAGQLRNMDGRQAGFRIHLPDVRREDQRRAGLFEQGEVGGFVARIGGEILVRPELGWVDEDGRDDGVATRSSRVDEADMAGVQRPHCRREANGKSFCAQFGDAPAQAGDRALDAQPSAHGFLAALGE